MSKNKELKIAQKPIPSWAFQADRTNAWAFWNQAFTPEECQKIINYAEQFKKQDAYITNNNYVDLNVRESKIVWITHI